MSMLVDCSNCHTPLILPPGAKSIVCSVCQAVTRIADTPQFPVLPTYPASNSPFPGLTPSTYPTTSPFPGLTPSTYTHAPPSYTHAPPPFSHAPPSYDHASPKYSHAPPEYGHAPAEYAHAPSGFGYDGFPLMARQGSLDGGYRYGAAGGVMGVQGRKKAVIVGVSYKNTRHELKGCINDAKYMKHLLTSKFRFLEADIVMLTEEETDRSRIPTGKNMRAALSWLIGGCQPGDSLLFHFSGHGSRQRNRNGDELDGYDETLCPLDFETQGMIVDDEINATIVKPLPAGVKLHAIIDSCHSGTVLDLPYLCRMNSTGKYEWEDHRPKSGIWKGSSGGEVISISGCDDDQTSADTSALSKITSTGAMTFCFIEAIEHGNASTYGSLLSSMRNAISNASRAGLHGFTQEPQLTSCETFDMFTKPFHL